MKFTKILSVLMAVILAFSCCSAAVFAVNDPIPQPSAIVEDDIDSAFLEQGILVSALPEEELVEVSSLPVNDEITQQLLSVTKPAKGTGTAFTLKDCTFPGFSDRKIANSSQTFFQLLATLGIDNAFTGEYRILPDGTAEIVRIDNALRIVLIPSTICGRKVTSIGERALANGLTTTIKPLLITYNVTVPSLVFLPATVKSIGDMAFANCTMLTNVIASDSVVTIGDMAFAGCVNLRRVLFYSDVRQRLSDATHAMFEIFQLLLNDFLKDGSILDLLTDTSAWIHTHFFYNEHLREIGKAAFYGCEKLVRFYIPKTIKTISEYAFYGCKSLTDFVVNNAAEIKKWALANVKIDSLYLACDVRVDTDAFRGSLIGKLEYGGNHDDMPDLGGISPIVSPVVTEKPEWKDSVPVSEVIDLNVFTKNVEAQAALTFRSLNPITASVTPDGKSIVINGLGKAELVCTQEEDGTLNDGVMHTVTITTDRAAVHSELNLGSTVPYKRTFNVDLSVLRTADGDDLTPCLKASSGVTVEWNVDGVKVDWKADGNVCKIKCLGTGQLNVSATIKDADGNIVSSVTGKIGVDGNSAQASVRLVWWQKLLKFISIGLY